MTRMELEMYTAVPTSDINTYWFPCSWFVSVLKDACSKNKINDACGLKLIMEVMLICFVKYILAI